MGDENKLIRTQLSCQLAQIVGVFIDFMFGHYGR